VDERCAAVAARCARRRVPAVILEEAEDQQAPVPGVVDGHKHVLRRKIVDAPHSRCHLPASHHAMRGEAASAAQGGDIFAAKYVLKPIYDTVHLNFLILCFLGEDSRDIAARALGDCCRRATLIHLDSLRRAWVTHRHRPGRQHAQDKKRYLDKGTE